MKYPFYRMWKFSSTLEGSRRVSYYKMTYLLLIFVAKENSCIFQLTVQLMTGSFHIAIRCLYRKIIYTAKTNIHENQIYLSTLRASKLIYKKLCHSVTFVFCGFYNSNVIHVNNLLMLNINIEYFYQYLLDHYMQYDKKI